MNPFAPGLMSGKVALVTGGGTGIGLATARMLGGLGARVAIASRREEHLRPAADELAARGIDVLWRACDIREPAEVAALADAVAERFGPVDVLVNNAGGQFPAPAATLAPKGWDAVIRNNLNGTWYATQAVATRAMIPDRRGGAIVNVIANIERGFPGMAHTGAARAGVENLTRSLAVEWAEHRVRVNAIAPGVIATDGIRQYGEIAIEAGRRRSPQKRLGTPEEVAAAIVFLASPAASFVTGVTLYVDGGARLWGDTWMIPDPPEGVPT